VCVLLAALGVASGCSSHHRASTTAPPKPQLSAPEQHRLEIGLARQSIAGLGDVVAPPLLAALRQSSDPALLPRRAGVSLEAKTATTSDGVMPVLADVRGPRTGRFQLVLVRGAGGHWQLLTTVGLR